VTPDVITGAGYLQANGPVSSHIYGTNAYQVWITNVTAIAESNGTTAISFTIEGGQDGYMYDVFATGALESPLNNALWFWMGQGGHFTNYSISIHQSECVLNFGDASRFGFGRLNRRIRIANITYRPEQSLLKFRRYTGRLGCLARD
jgi:hypothetical protein